MPTLPKDFNKQVDFKRFERFFDKVVKPSKTKNRKKESAFKFLTPHKIKKHIESGRPLRMKYGNTSNDREITYKDFLDNKHNWDFGWIIFDLDDLKVFERSLTTAARRKIADGAGVPIVQILKSAESNRIKRANKQIRTALLYRSKDNEFSFQVSAGPRSKRNFHLTRVRFEAWENKLADPKVNNYTKAAREIIKDGHVSVDCDCEDFQYRHRYWMTRWDAALKPVERDFPKIRNPKIGEGVVCKHLIKTLSVCDTPIMISRVAKEFERQAKEGGFTGKEKFLTKKDIDAIRKQIDNQAERVRIKEIHEEWKKYKKAQKAFAKNQEDLSERLKRSEKQNKQMKKEIDKLKAADKAKEKARKAKETAEKRKAEKQVKDDMVRVQLQAAIDATKAFNIPREDVIKNFAKQQGLNVGDVEKMAEGIK